MDTFFRRHFKKKEASDAQNKSCRQRRPSVAVPASRARRRSSVGLPSSSLTQRRRSSVQLHTGIPTAVGGRLTKAARRNRWAGPGRRRSSTTTPGANPRFAVSRKKVGKLRTIDTHLLGPSMLLASLIQMAEEEEEGGGAGLPAAAQQMEVMGRDDNMWMFSSSSSLHSDGADDGCGFSSANESQSDEEQAEQLPEEEDDASWTPERRCSLTPSPCTSSSLGLEMMRKTPQPPPSRPLIRAPRCLRRNSSQVFAGDSAPYGRYRASTRRKRRRISTISKAGSPWPGRGLPMPNRKSSVYYLNHPAFYRGPGALSPLGPHHYDSQLESWSSFLLYVVPDLHPDPCSELSHDPHAVSR